MASKRKNRATVYRFQNPEVPGEHYTVRLSKLGHEKITEKVIKKYSPKLRKHTNFKLTKKITNKG